MQSLPRLLAAGTRLFYRLELSGRAPADGPALFVANHPNSLLDPALVGVAVGRQVRFLAKHTLFDDPKVGWLVRAAGSVPVYRQQDGPAPAGGNDAMFAAARAVLAGGGAIGVFGEGVSHADPHLRPLKTGPARLALGTARELGRAFPVVPVGITLADRAAFRSAALVVVGEPVAWDDLAGRADGDQEAVRALTRRVDAALRAVTANFDSWADARLVAFAEAVHAAELGAVEPGAPGAERAAPGDLTPSPARLARWRIGADALARLRGPAAAAAGAAAPDGAEAADAGDGEAAALARDLRGHARLLGALGLAPADLHERTDLGTAAGWGARRLPLAAAGALTAFGTALAWPAYRAVGAAAARFPGAEASDVRATAKFLVGALVFVLWTLALAAAAAALAWRAGGWGWGLAAGACTLAAAPALAVYTLRTAERWRGAGRDARRFLQLRGRAARVAELRARQRALAERVEAAVAAAGAVAAGAVVAPADAGPGQPRAPGGGRVRAG